MFRVRFFLAGILLLMTGCASSHFHNIDPMIHMYSNFDEITVDHETTIKWSYASRPEEVEVSLGISGNPDCESCWMKINTQCNRAGNIYVAKLGPVKNCYLRIKARYRKTKYYLIPGDQRDTKFINTYRPLFNDDGRLAFRRWN